MSTRPDPEGSDTVEIAARRCPRLRVVWDLRELRSLSILSDNMLYAIHVMHQINRHLAVTGDGGTKTMAL